MNYIGLVLLLLLPIAAEGQLITRRLTLKRGVLAPIGHCRPVDPECPVPPRVPTGAKLFNIGDLAKPLGVTTARDVAFALTRPGGSPDVIDFGVAVYAGQDRVFKEMCNCKEELSKLKPGETIVFTFDKAASKELARHFVAKNSILISVISNEDTTSQITVFRKKALSQ